MIDLTVIKAALAEDIGSGDIHAALVPADKIMQATVTTREAGVLCGQAFFDAVFSLIDPRVAVHWEMAEGASIVPHQTLCILQGPASALLTGERTALNFLQTLSGIATATHRYVEKIAGGQTKILDTRKTLPGLRAIQKYAVRIGGGHNHRMGLYDAFLIKENHIIACGSLTRAIEEARKQHPETLLEVEVETLDELQIALDLKVKRILCDNFTVQELKDAVALTQNKAELEASGNITLENIALIAASGIHYISIGALTKHVQALDFSLRIA